MKERLLALGLLFAKWLRTFKREGELLQRTVWLKDICVQCGGRVLLVPYAGGSAHVCGCESPLVEEETP